MLDVAGAAGVAAVREEHRSLDQRRRSRVLHRDLDDRDLVVRRLAVRERGARRVGRDVEVDALAVLGRHHRVGVRTAVGLDGRDVLRGGLVGDVEDLDALPRLLDRGGLRDAVARVVVARRVGRQEQQVPVHRDVVLRARAEHLALEHRLLRVADVVDDEAVVVADERVVVLERDVGVRAVERSLLVQVRDPHHVAAPADLVLGGNAGGTVRPRFELSLAQSRPVGGKVGLGERGCRQR